MKKSYKDSTDTPFVKSFKFLNAINSEHGCASFIIQCYKYVSLSWDKRIHRFWNRWMRDVKKTYPIGNYESFFTSVICFGPFLKIFFYCFVIGNSKSFNFFIKKRSHNAYSHQRTLIKIYGYVQWVHVRINHTLQ